MGRITQHPIRSKLGALTRALVANGFTLHDDRSASEIESVDWAFALYETPDFQSKRRIALEEDGRYTLRTNVLATQLDTMRGPLPLRTFCIGRTFDGNDAAIPAHWTIEASSSKTSSARPSGRAAGRALRKRSTASARKRGLSHSMRAPTKWNAKPKALPSRSLIWEKHPASSARF